MKRFISLLVAIFVIASSPPVLAQSAPITWGNVSAIPSFVSTQGSLIPRFGFGATNFTSYNGTSSPTWQLSATTGPQWSNNNGVIEARNAALSAFTIVRGATPVAANDLVTKAYADSGVASVTIPSLTGVATSVGCLSWNGSAYVWTTCSGGGTAVSGTGLWYSVGGSLNGTGVGFSGDATFGALTGGNLPITLATVNGNVGTFGSTSLIPSITVNAKGLVTAVATNTVAAPLGSATGTLTVSHGGTGLTTLTANGVLIGEGTSNVNGVVLGNTQILVGQTAADPQAKTVSGDATLSNAGALTLATVNSNTGSFGSTSLIPSITVNGKGLITAVSTNTVAAPLGSATGTLAVTQLGHGTDGQVLQTNGTTPTWNTFSQDVTVTDTGVATVNSIHGSSPIAITPSTLQFAQTTAAPELAQVQQANGSAPNSMHIAPQQPGAGAGSTSTGTPGSLFLDLSSPVSTGNEAEFYVTRGGTKIAAMGPQPGGGTTVSDLWLFSGASAPTNANYTLQEDATDTWLSANGGSLHLVASGNQWETIFGTTAHRGIALGYPGTLDAAGGDNVLTLNPVLTVPNTALSNSNDVTFYNDAGNFELFAKGIQFNSQQTNITIGQPAPASGNGTFIQIIAQQGAASGSTNGGTAFLAGGPAGSGGFGVAGDGAIGSGDFAVTISAHEVSPGVGEARSTIDNATSDIAPDGQGTVNTQLNTSNMHRRNCTTTSATQVQCGNSFTVATSHIITVEFLISARDVTTPGTQNNFSAIKLCQFYNSGGTMAAVGSCAQLGATTGTNPNLGGAVFVPTASGSNVTIFVGGITGTDAYDWTVDDRIDQQN